MALVFSAVVLAAGRSSRMGRDKALLISSTTDGRPLWERQRDVLQQSGATEIFISARADQTWTHAVRGESGVVYDAEADLGPIAGIAAAFEKTPASHLAVLAVDLPAMEPAWFVTLAANCEPGRGAVGRRGKFFEPLAAIYSRDVLPLLRDALGQRELSLQRFLAAAVAAGPMREREILPEERPWFENRNEPSSAL